MSLLDRLASSPPPPWDDYWYTPFGQTEEATATGKPLHSGTALQIAAVFACVRVVAETVATVPFQMFERQGDGKRRVARDHPLYQVLHRSANDFQTAVEFRELMTAFALLRGNAYAYITEPRPNFYQLIPLHPELVRYEQAGNPRAPYLIYYVKWDGSTEERVATEDMFHLRGFNGLSVVSLAREAMGMAIAAERYGAKFFGQGQRPAGAVEHPKGLSDRAYDRIRQQLKEWHGGVDNSHRLLILEEGMKWTQVGLSAQDSQFLETRRFQVEEIARWFRVPLHKIGQLDRSTNNNIEQQALEFVSDAIRPWCVRWEQTVQRDLVLAPDRFYAEHNLDAILRGDVSSRYAAFSTGLQNGFLSPNEIREMENLNSRDDKWGDAFLLPLNARTTADPEPPPEAAPGSDPKKPQGPGSGKDNEPPENQPEPSRRKNQLEAAWRGAVRRVMKNERRGVERAENDEAVEKVYWGHARQLEDALGMSVADALEYCKERVRVFRTGGRAALFATMDEAEAGLRNTGE